MSARRNFEWPKLLTADGRGIAFGGDYNPDQWSEDIWDDDIRLMKQAGVNTVALAIFSWDRIQPTEDRWDFGWLDRIIDKLGNAGIVVDLASATATAPLWLYESHPEVLPRDKYGHPVNAGSRQSWSPTSPVFKEYALRLCRRLAEHYKDNPYVTAWHMGNEYGWNNREDYSDNALDAFRAWCRRKYGTIGALNQAWGTTFWGQEMNGFDEVLIPRFMGADSMVNPGQKLDFERFGNDMLLDFYKAERDAIAEICPDKPFTTNFMVSTDQCCMDYAAWAKEVNFVSNDHYFHEGESHLDELACSDALMDSLALGKPWYVMEHSTSAVQWKPLNTRKRKGETVRDSLAHVAMGADAINFFQWRASAFGAEAFHSAMVPHAGEDTKLFRQVCELGASLHTLADAGVQGTELAHSDTAILFSAESEWATRSQTLPSMKLNHWHDVRDWYRAFLDAGSRADIVPLAYDWTDYKTIVLPTVLGPRDAAPVKADPAIAGKNVEGGCLLAPGGGDNAMASLGLGMAVGDVSISLGTSGVAAAISENPTYDLTGAVSGFADCTGHYLPLACTINGSRILDAGRAALGVDYDELAKLAFASKPGANGITLVPYFDGERTPNRPNATATFSGMTLANTTRENLARAFVEGLLCSQRDCLELIRSLGASITRILLIGGGAKSEAIRTLAPSILGMDVTRPATDEYVAIGAARQAAWVLSGETEPPAWQLTIDGVETGEPTEAVYEAYAKARG